MATPVVETIAVDFGANTITSIAFDQITKTYCSNNWKLFKFDHVYRSFNALDSVPELFQFKEIASMPVYSAVMMLTMKTTL